MPNVSPDEVIRLAALARIEITPEEAAHLATDLGNILEHVTRLEGASPAPMSYIAPERNVFREDAADPHIGMNAKDQFPDSDGAFLRVPRVF